MAFYNKKKFTRNKKHLDEIVASGSFRSISVQNKNSAKLALYQLRMRFWILIDCYYMEFVINSNFHISRDVILSYTKGVFNGGMKFFSVKKEFLIASIFVKHFS